MGNIFRHDREKMINEKVASRKIAAFRCAAAAATCMARQKSLRETAARVICNPFSTRIYRVCAAFQLFG